MDIIFGSLLLIFKSDVGKYLGVFLAYLALHIVIGGVCMYSGVVYQKSLVLKYPEESEQLRNDTSSL